MIIVLCYHALSPTWTAELSTTPERFEHQLHVLKRRGYQMVTFSQAVSAPATARVAAVTFDDAFASVFTLARPILERLGVPGTLFVPSGPIDACRALAWPGIDHWQNGPAAAELTAMTWSQIADLAASGWEIGSHTVSHPHLTTLDSASLASELGQSKAACEDKLGIACSSIAYPYGDVDARVVDAARAAGYVAGAALPGTLGGRDPLQWPRVGVYAKDSAARYALKISPLVSRLRRTAARGSARADGM